MRFEHNSLLTFRCCAGSVFKFNMFFFNHYFYFEASSLKDFCTKPDVSTKTHTLLELWGSTKGKFVAIHCATTKEKWSYTWPTTTFLMPFLPLTPRYAGTVVSLTYQTHQPPPYLLHPPVEPDCGEGGGWFLGEGALRGDAGFLPLPGRLRPPGPDDPAGSGLSTAAVCLPAALPLPL